MKISVLDFGYVELIETWGSDEQIIESARMSTDKGFLGWGPVHDTHCNSIVKRFYTNSDHDDLVSHTGECNCTPKLGDEKLLKYLYDNKHMTPFEMAGMIIEVKAPIFIFREWHRHRTQSYNEMSARYTPLPNENYIPTVERLMLNSKVNKQAGTIKGAEELTEERARLFRTSLEEIYIKDQNIYEAALQMGIPKELARIHLPVGRYSKMRASANLRNWLAFLTLRMDEHAMWEIQQYANIVGDLIKEAHPRTWELFVCK